MMKLRPNSIPPPPSPTRYYRALSRRTVGEFDEIIRDNAAAVTSQGIELAFEAVLLRMELKAGIRLT